MAKARVIGYEGRRDPKASASWGAAAIVVGDFIVNGATGLKEPFTDEGVDELAKAGSLTRLEQSIEIRQHEGDTPIVLEIAAAILEDVGANQLHETAKARRGSFTTASDVVLIFGTREAFDEYRRAVINKVVQHVLYAKVTASKRELLIRTSLILHAHDGAANAMHAFYSAEFEGDRDFAFELARARVRDDAEAVALDRLHRALIAATRAEKGLFEDDDDIGGGAKTADGRVLGNGMSKFDYAVKYRDGVAAGRGGLSLPDAQRIVQSVATLDHFARDTAQRRFSFLRKPPATHLQQIGQGSAILHFTPFVEEEPFGDRVARYLALTVLQDVIEGKHEGELEHTQTLVEAHRTVVKPDSDTAVAHRGLQDSEYRAIEAVTTDDDRELPEPKGPLTSEPLTCLGYQSGLLDEWGKLEINIFPGRRLRLSAEANDLGKPPLNIETLRGRNDFLFRPALFTIVRTRMKWKRRYWLREVRLLEPGESGTITAMPSNFVDDGFLYRLSLPVVHEDGSLKIEGLAPDEEDETANINVGRRELARAQEWMRAYDELCLEYELRDVRKSRLAPIVMPRATAFQRALVVLYEAGHALERIDLARKVEEVFLRDQPFHLRQVLKNATRYMRYREDEGGVYLTDDGKRAAQAYLAVERRGISARRSRQQG